MSGVLHVFTENHDQEHKALERKKLGYLKEKIEF